MGCTIGTTMTITDKVVPGWWGWIWLRHGNRKTGGKRKIVFTRLDVSHQYIVRIKSPAGRNSRHPHPFSAKLTFRTAVFPFGKPSAGPGASIGTTWGRQHFIEVGQSRTARSGSWCIPASRHIGSEVAKHNQKEGLRTLVETPASNWMTQSKS
jgi:hypothetical protein